MHKHGSTALRLCGYSKVEESHSGTFSVKFLGAATYRDQHRVESIKGYCHDFLFGFYLLKYAFCYFVLYCLISVFFPVH